ncbi:hypothetical protein KF913_13155 [Candidatus Obscuribacterales bacterium]|nr:hypothetical protein [Candidatus Obscuribacterales bacterium]
MKRRSIHIWPQRNRDYAFRLSESVDERQPLLVILQTVSGVDLNWTHLPLSELVPKLLVDAILAEDTKQSARRQVSDRKWLKELP